MHPWRICTHILDISEKSVRNLIQLFWWQKITDNVSIQGKFSKFEKQEFFMSKKGKIDRILAIFRGENWQKKWIFWGLFGDFWLEKSVYFKFWKTDFSYSQLSVFVKISTKFRIDFTDKSETCKKILMYPWYEVGTLHEFAFNLL